MYEYKKQNGALQGLGVDRYVPGSASSQLAPWATAYTTVQNIDVKCYHNMPREEVLRRMSPYTMEISTPGNHFICIGNPDQECPESVHRNTDPKDPWRQRQCATWRQGWEQEAANIIASQEFRSQVTENILDAAGITGWRRWFTKPAEFIQVLDEKERRERGIKIFALVTIAAGGGFVFWKYLNNKKNKVSQNPEQLLHEPPIEYGDGDHQPIASPGIVSKIMKKMVRSARLAGLKPHHINWERQSFDRRDGTWKIGNRVYDSTFGFFEVLPSASGDKIYYKTNSKWTRARHGWRYDTKQQLTKQEALDLAESYYTGLRDTLLALENKAKSRFGTLTRAFHIWNPKTRLIEEHNDGWLRNVGVSRNPLDEAKRLERLSEKTGAKKLVFRKTKRGPGRLPDYAPNIARQLYDRMAYSAKKLGRGRMIREASPTWEHQYKLRKGYGWYIGTNIGDGSINHSLGFFWVDKNEEVNYRDIEKTYEDGPRGHGWQSRYPMSYEEALFTASNYYQDRAKAGVI